MKYSVARIPRVKVSKEDSLKGQAMVNIQESAPCILIVLAYPARILSAIGEIGEPSFQIINYRENRKHVLFSRACTLHSSFSFPLKCSTETIREKFWYFIKASKEVKEK